MRYIRSSEYLDVSYDAPDRNVTCLIRLRERSFQCVDKLMHHKAVEYIKAGCLFVPLLLSFLQARMTYIHFAPAPLNHYQVHEREIA
jgi:hypothetical protein